MRLNILHNAIFFFLGLIIAALIYMQMIRGDFYRGQSLNNRIRAVASDAPRGTIVDRNGKLLADNRTSYNVAIVPQDIEDKEALFNFLGKVLNKDPQVIKKIYNRRHITPFEPVIVAEDVERSVLLTVEENRFQYSGLVIEKSFERLYPFHEAGAHVLGYVGKIDPDQVDAFGQYGYTPHSLVGKNGIEQFYEATLHGEPGGRQIEVNSRGQEVRLLGIKEPVKGKDIVLTVDQRVQSAAMELLGARRGSVVVMDLANGDIISLVSSPAFDPNAFTDRSQRGRIAVYARDPLGPFLNRAIGGQYPPGSVFKIPVALAAIERNKITPDISFDCPGYYMLGQARFGCAHVHGKENLLQAIAHSCNVYFFHIGQMVTAPIIGAYAKAFGLGHLTGIDLPFEVKGKLLMPGQRREGLPAGRQGWFTGNTLNLSIGQGDTLTTPLQLTVLIAAVANNGIVLRPRILKAMDGNVVPDPDLSKRPLIRLHDATWKIVQDGLRQVVEEKEGTGHLLNDLNGMTIWGKTGTAQAGRNKENHAWFTGYVRSSKSNLAFCVFLEHGGSSANAVFLTHDLLLRMQSFDVI